ncbi:hypothetical protein C9933_00990 [Methylophaga nitratireducenticrescens]|nr:hypothetical protein C9933_00990 [Methylophaga nitratireducenticrescens]
MFTAWCDAFTAEGLVSLAANRIFGNITTLSDEEYAKRSEWVDDNYGLAADRFTNRTGHDFQKIYQYALENDWVQHCQFEDVIQ